MSYSRWSNSKWYSFWNVDSGESKSEQILSLWHVGNDYLTDFNYGDLKQFDLSVMKEIFSEVPEDELIEGLGYIKEFIEDVDLQYLQDDLK